MTDYLFFDIETTGINSFKDQIVLIGFMDEDGRVNQFYGDKEMFLLSDAMNFLKYKDPKTLIGWKIYKFDIPFLCARLIKYSMFEEVKYIRHIINKVDMAHFLEMFAIDKRHVRSDDISEYLGIKINDKFDGSDVPSLFKVGDFESICEHNLADLRLLKRIYSKLSEVIY